MNTQSGGARSQLVWLILLLGVGIFYYASAAQRQAQSAEAPISRVAAEVGAGNVAEIEITEETLSVRLKDETRLVSRIEDGATLAETLLGLGVAPEQLTAVVVQVNAAGQWSGLIMLVTYLLPGLVVVGLVFFMLRQSQGQHNQALSFGRSRARLKDPLLPGVTFADVAGAEEAKQELVEVVEFLKEPEKFIRLGARIPKGVLLVGSPGTGKTLLAKAVSGEAGVPFFSIAASEFVEMFVGVGASRVRDLFTQAKRHAPCIVFVDEIDAVGRHRGAGLGSGHDEREQTLNQILVEMDGFDTDTNVIVVAATNRPDILAPALLRPGRFDRRVVLDRPDARGREAILRVHAKGKPLAADVDLAQIARATPGFVGADLENLVNEAALLAARRDKKSIGPAKFQEAVERVIAGPERKSRVISDRDRRVTAYHEAGHALVMRALPECDPVRKVSIIARGTMGGYTLSLPADDRALFSRTKFRADLAAVLGGRVAEELAFADVTTGAANDLERATQLARAMVTRYGMSEALGPMVFGQKRELVFLGKEITEQRDYSEQVAAQIDAEVRKLVDASHQRATCLLTEWRPKLDRGAAALLEEETIDGRRLAQLCEGG